MVTINLDYNTDNFNCIEMSIIYIPVFLKVTFSFYTDTTCPLLPLPPSDMGYAITPVIADEEGLRNASVHPVALVVGQRAYYVCEKLLAKIENNSSQPQFDCVLGENENGEIVAQLHKNYNDTNVWPKCFMSKKRKDSLFI